MAGSPLAGEERRARREEIRRGLEGRGGGSVGETDVDKEEMKQCLVSSAKVRFYRAIESHLEMIRIIHSGLF